MRAVRAQTKDRSLNRQRVSHRSKDFFWRQARRAVRSWKRELKSRKRRCGSGGAGGQRGVALPLLSFFRNNFSGTARLKNTDFGITVEIPRIFSFIRAPEEAHQVIASVLAASETDARQIFLDYENCEDTDACAALVLGILAKELLREWKAQKLKRAFAGSWPKNEHVRSVMRCTGIIHHLGIKSQSPSAKEIQGFERFDFVRGFTSSQFRRSSQQEKTAQDLTEYFVRCFHRLGLAMSDKAQGEMVELLGEVMDNAERHSGRNEWFAQAYFDQASGETGGVCHLAIVSLGQSMSQTLEASQNAPKTAERIAELIANHERVERFMGLVAPRTKECLLTLYALQDGVSCTGAPGAGSGTVRLIEHFQQLSKPDEGCSRMTVISGRAQILFDQKYRMQLVDGRKVIAFNRSNSLDEPPSTDNVRQLENFFPGTLIALRFEMEKGYIQEKAQMTNETV